MSVDPRDRSHERTVDPIPPEDADSAPVAKRGAPLTADDVPVPPVMSPAEIDERAQVVERIEDDEVTP